MNPLKIRTREQQYLAIPLVGGILAGLAGLIYLFSIPGDPKNSLYLGFSLFRLLEGLVILAGSGFLAIFVIKISRDPDCADRIISILGWQNETPWSLASAWISLLAVLFFAGFGRQVFPGKAQVIERIFPLFIWIFFTSLFFCITVLARSGRKSFGIIFQFLVKVGLISIAIGLVVGLILFPASIGLMLRGGSLVMLVLISPVLYFSFEKQGIMGSTTSLVFVGLLFGGALIGVWAGGISDANIVAGLLPFNDANGYFHGGRLLAEGHLFHPFSAKRPLFPALLGVFYWISGENLQYTIGCLTVIVILSVYFAAREIKSSAGSMAAVFLVFGLFLFTRRFIGSTMSEMLGLPLGTIGFALLWSSAVRQRLAEAVGGILLLSLGLLSRAGPFFMLPALVLWVGWIFRKDGKFNWKAVAYSTAAAGTAFVIHLVIYKVLSAENSSSMANFSYTLYGLVTGGKGWKQYMLDHPDVLSLIEPYQSQAIYRYAWEAFKSHPSAIIQGAIRYWQVFFTLDWYGAFGFIDGATLTETMIGRGVMAVLSVGGLLAAIRKIRKPEYSMVLAGIIGVVLSVPFVPTVDAEIRTYAAGIPWFIGLCLPGILEIRSLLRKEKIHVPEETGISRISYGNWTMAVGMVFLIFAAPLLLHGFVPPKDVPADSSCTGDNLRFVTMISRGSYINVVPDASRKQSMVPDLRYTDYQTGLHDSPMLAMAQDMMEIKPGYSTFTGYNWVDNKLEDVTAKTELFESNQGWVELCGWRDTNPTGTGFFHAESARKITQ